MHLEAAQALFFRLRAAKQASGNTRLIDTAIPEGVRSLMQSWPQANPSFSHRVFSSEAAATFIELHGSERVRQAFSACLSPVLLSDLFHLVYLHVHGGIYADADDRCRHALLPLLKDGAELILHQEDIGSIGNNVIAAASGHSLIARALELAVTNVLEQEGSNPWFLTGPGVLTLAFCELYGPFITDPAAPPPHQPSPANPREDRAGHLGRAARSESS